MHNLVVHLPQTYAAVAVSKTAERKSEFTVYILFYTMCDVLDVNKIETQLTLVICVHYSYKCKKL